jgi:hypothetical protein
MNTVDSSFVVNAPSRSEAIRTVKTQIRAWIGSPPFLDLLSIYSGNPEIEGDLNGALVRLEQFSDRWDFRRIAREQGAATDDNLRHGSGAARWLSAETGLSSEIQERVVEDARQLGLIIADDPKEKVYEYALVLGGARLSCELRSRRAAEVIRSGVSIGTVGLLGAARPISDSEREATDTYAPGARDEFDLMLAGARSAFGATEKNVSEERYDHPTELNLGWIDKRFEIDCDGSAVHFIAVSAPSSDPSRRRANSADTIKFFLERVRVQKGASLLLITSQIYVPYIQLEALRTVAIPHNLYVETIGFPGDRMPAIQGLTSTNNYLQEIRSAIQAARRFCAEYPS